MINCETRSKSCRTGCLQIKCSTDGTVDNGAGGKAREVENQKECDSSPVLLCEETEQVVAELSHR